MEYRNITVEMPVQTIITYELSTKKTDEEIIEDIKEFGGDFHLRCAGYEIDNVCTDIDDELYDDRNSTFVRDADNEALIYEYDPNYAN